MKNHIIILFLLILPFTVFSQMPNPVGWSIKAVKTGSNEAELTITANIDEPWFLYSQFLEDGGPRPTEITYAKSEAYVLIGTATENGSMEKEYNDALFGNMQVKKLGGTVVFQQKIKLHRNNGQLIGSLNYQTCNGEMCLPPKDVAFKVNLTTFAAHID